MSQRSGTTALVHTLNAHPGAALGVERYKFRWRDWPQQYDPSLFEADRFFDLDEAETNIRATDRWEKYYDRLRTRWRPDTLSGDKVQPISREMVAGILEATPRAKFLYPFRQLLPLASSYAVRARDPEDRNWAANRGAMAGLKVWQQDNRAVLDLVEDPDLGPAILPVAYEDFFPGDPVTVRAVLDHVGLPDDPAFDKAVQDNAERFASVQQKELALTYEEVDQLLPHIHDPAHVALRRHAPSRDRDDPTTTPEVRVAQLEQHAADLYAQLTRLRNRRSVKAALTVADGVGRVRQRLQDRG